MGRPLEVLNRILRWRNKNMGDIRKMIFSLVYIFYCSIKSEIHMGRYARNCSFVFFHQQWIYNM